MACQKSVLKARGIVLFAHPRIHIRWLIKPSMNWRRASEHRAHSARRGSGNSCKRITSIHLTTNILTCIICIARRRAKEYMSLAQDTPFVFFCAGTPTASCCALENPYCRANSNWWSMGYRCNSCLLDDVFCQHIGSVEPRAGKGSCVVYTTWHMLVSLS